MSKLTSKKPVDAAPNFHEALCAAKDRYMAREIDHSEFHAACKDAWRASFGQEPDGQRLAVYLAGANVLVHLEPSAEAKP